MRDTHPVLEAVGLRKSYGKTVVLDGLDLTVRRGTVLALLGPNGAGKTTTVRILTTLTRPDAGRATVAGHDVVAAPAAVRRAISLTGQYAAVDLLLTGEENLRMMGRLARLGRAGARRRANELLERFDLVEARGRRVKTYSGGMRRRIDLAMSLVARPQVLFLDEPTTGLDLRSRQAVWDAVSELVADEVTVFLTTQYLEEADRLADRVAVIDSGKLVAEGSADELKRQVGAEQVELVLADRSLVAKASLLLDTPSVVGSEGDRLRLPTDGTAAHLRHLLNHLEQHDVAVESVSVHRPSLDDVFLALTGEPARTTGQQAASGLHTDEEVA